MIERKFIKEKVNDYKIREFIKSFFEGKGFSHCSIQKTPLGEKIIIYTSKPGLVVGRGGKNIKDIVKELKSEFDLQSPRIEVQEVEEPYLDPKIVAEKIAYLLTRIGPTKFKYIGHSTIEKVMSAGAMGVEIWMNGRIPGKRSKRWHFTEGYVPKCGGPADYLVKKGYSEAQLYKSGMAGVTVRILPPGSTMPDEIEIKEQEEEKKEVKKTEKNAKVVEEKTVSEKAEKVEEAIEESKKTKNKSEKKKKSLSKKTDEVKNVKKIRKEKKPVEEIRKEEKPVKEIREDEKKYSEMNARPLIKKVKEGDVDKKVMKKLLSEDDRKTVKNAVKKELYGDAYKYFDKNARPIIEAVSEGELSKKELKKLLEHEKKNKNRKTVIEAIKEEVEKE